MSAASQLLRELTSRGLTVRVVDGSNLSVSPRSSLDEQLMARMRECKADLLRELARTAVEHCPPLPHGVRLVRYQPKAPPVAIDVCSVVTDVGQFVSIELNELDARLHNPVQIRGGFGVFAILDRLRQVGLELEIIGIPEP